MEASSSSILRKTFFALLASVALAHPAVAAPTQAQRCLAAKLKAVGKYDLCVLKTQAKAVLAGTTADFANCGAKFTQKWTKADAKFGADCPSASAAMAAGEVDEHVTAILELLADGGGPLCGNDQIEAGEACDGPALGGQTCVSQGFDGGTLGCNNMCAFDTSACTDDPCDPLTQDCDVNEGCYAEEAVGPTTCQTAGVKTEGQTCTTANDCVAGHMCATQDTTKICRQVCSEDDETLPCPGGQTCVEEALGDGAGVCF